MTAIEHHKYPSFIATTIVTLLIVGFYGALMFYIHAKKNEVGLRATELSSEIKRKESMHDLAGFVKDLSGEKEELASFFVSPDAAVGIIERIEDLSRTIGAPVVIGEVRLEDENKETGEGTLLINVSSQGGWKSTAQLLFLLDTLPFASTIDSVTLAALDPFGEGGTLWSLRGVVRVALRR